MFNYLCQARLWVSKLPPDVSGLATVASFHYGQEFGDLNLKGGWFGAVLALYLWLFRGVRAWKGMLIVVTSIVAYNLAVFAGMLDPFFAGALGASFLGAAALFLLSPDQSGLVILRFSIALGVAGGVLASFGWGLGPSLGARISLLMDRLDLHTGSSLLNQESVNAVHPLWQAGMGALFGVVFWLLDRKAIGPDRLTGKPSRLTTIAKAFFTCMIPLLLLGVVSFVLRW